MTDSARKRAEKLHRMWCSHSGTGHPIWLDKAVEMFTARDRDLWRKAQEQMRVRAAEFVHNWKRDDNRALEEHILTLPLDPLPASEEESNVPRS
jgi:hypothetical protein